MKQTPIRLYALCLRALSARVSTGARPDNPILDEHRLNDGTERNAGMMRGLFMISRFVMLGGLA
ncbi:MAG: hypothetical protein WA858_02385, partial [Xanthobacteraceae bacterium]